MAKYCLCLAIDPRSALVHRESLIICARLAQLVERSFVSYWSVVRVHFPHHFPIDIVSFFIHRCAENPLSYPVQPATLLPLSSRYFPVLPRRFLLAPGLSIRHEI